MSFEFAKPFEKPEPCENVVKLVADKLNLMTPDEFGCAFWPSVDELISHYVHRMLTKDDLYKFPDLLDIEKRKTLNLKSMKLRLALRQESADYQSSGHNFYDVVYDMLDLVYYDKKFRNIPNIEHLYAGPKTVERVAEILSSLCMGSFGIPFLLDENFYREFDRLGDSVESIDDILKLAPICVIFDYYKMHIGDPFDDDLMDWETKNESFGTDYKDRIIRCPGIGPILEFKFGHLHHEYFGTLVLLAHTMVFKVKDYTFENFLGMVYKDFSHEDFTNDVCEYVYPVRCVFRPYLEELIKLTTQPFESILGYYCNENARFSYVLEYYYINSSGPPIDVFNAEMFPSILEISNRLCRPMSMNMKIARMYSRIMNEPCDNMLKHIWYVFLSEAGKCNFSKLDVLLLLPQSLVNNLETDFETNMKYLNGEEGWRYHGDKQVAVEKMIERILKAQGKGVVGIKEIDVDLHTE